MGFETTVWTAPGLRGQDHEHIPMGFETQEYPESDRRKRIMSTSLWDLKLKEACKKEEEK